VAEEGRHCMDHGKTPSAYRWYVREKRSSEPEVIAGRGSAPRVDYLCNAAAPAARAHRRRHGGGPPGRPRRRE